MSVFQQLMPALFINKFEVYAKPRKQKLAPLVLCLKVTFHVLSLRTNLKPDCVSPNTWLNCAARRQFEPFVIRFTHILELITTKLANTATKSPVRSLFGKRIVSGDTGTIL